MTIAEIFANPLGFLILLLMNAILNGAPLLFGTAGEILTEKSGNLNLGVEGLMYMGGAFGLTAVYMLEKGGVVATPLLIMLAILVSFIAGAIGSLIYGFLTITLRTNQNVTGLALSIFGTGLGKFVCELVRLQDTNDNITVSFETKTAFSASPFPQFLQDIPYVGQLLFGHNIFVYLGIIMTVLMAIYIKNTRFGLNLRSVGESPATADAAGINVTLHKYLATIIGGGISAIGGMVYTMTLGGGVWNQHGLSGQGWLAVALVIFCLWRPLNALWGSLLFGCLSNLYLRLRLSWMPNEIYKILPYIITVIVLVITSLRRKHEDQPPESLGLAYFREDR